jgi:NhaP-type Na+/H+ or K+/H+ antiporter
VFVTGSTLTAAAVITIPAVFGDGAPILDISGATPISGMTYAVVGVTLPVSGYMITLNFAGAGTITSGTSGTAGQFLLNGRTNFTTAANSSLTVRLSHLGNWVEVGRCA